MTYLLIALSAGLVALLALSGKGPGQKLNIEGREYRVYKSGDVTTIVREFMGYDALTAKYHSGVSGEGIDIAISPRLKDDPATTQLLRLYMAHDVTRHYDRFGLPAPTGNVDQLLADIEAKLRELLGQAGALPSA